MVVVVGFLSTVLLTSSVFVGLRSIPSISHFRALYLPRLVPRNDGIIPNAYACDPVENTCNPSPPSNPPHVSKPGKPNENTISAPGSPNEPSGKSGPSGSGSGSGRTKHPTGDQSPNSGGKDKRNHDNGSTSSNTPPTSTSFAAQPSTPVQTAPYQMGKGYEGDMAGSSFRPVAPNPPVGSVAQCSGPDSSFFKCPTSTLPPAASYSAAPVGKVNYNPICDGPDSVAFGDCGPTRLYGGDCPNGDPTCITNGNDPTCLAGEHPDSNGHCVPDSTGGGDFLGGLIVGGIVVGGTLGGLGGSGSGNGAGGANPPPPAPPGPPLPPPVVTTTVSNANPLERVPGTDWFHQHDDSFCRIVSHSKVCIKPDEINSTPCQGAQISLKRCVLQTDPSDPNNPKKWKWVDSPFHAGLPDGWHPKGSGYGYDPQEYCNGTHCVTIVNDGCIDWTNGHCKLIVDPNDPTNPDKWRFIDDRCIQHGVSGDACDQYLRDLTFSKPHITGLGNCYTVQEIGAACASKEVADFYKQVSIGRAIASNPLFGAVAGICKGIGSHDPYGCAGLITGPLWGFTNGFTGKPGSFGPGSYINQKGYGPTFRPVPPVGPVPTGGGGLIAPHPPVQPPPPTRPFSGNGH